MRVLLDTCVWGGAKKSLTEAGYDTIWIGDLLKDPGDEAIIDLANQENRVLVTLDKDFGELAVVKGMPHSGIIRIVDHQAKEQGSVCVHILQKYGKELDEKAIITVTKNRIRVRSGEN